MPSSRYRQLQQLELELHRRWRLLSSGRHLGKATGYGVVPDGIKPYEPGDPPKFIDWYASARTDELMVRRRQVEHSLRALVCVDYPERLAWGGTQATVRKNEVCLAVADALVHLLTWQGDKTSVLLSGRTQTDSRMLSGTQAIRQALHLLVNAEPSAQDQLASTLANPNITRHRPQLIIVVGDFLSSGWGVPLRKLAYNHEVIAVQVLDDNDLHTPDLGVQTIGGNEYDFGDPKVRQAFDDKHAADQARREAYLSKYGIRHLIVNNHQPLVEQLVTQLAPPKRRKSAS